MSRLDHLELRQQPDGRFRLVEVLDDGTEHGDYLGALEHHEHYQHGEHTYWLLSSRSQWVTLRTRANGHTSGAYAMTPVDATAAPPAEWMNKARDRAARIEWRVMTRGAA